MSCANTRAPRRYFDALFVALLVTYKGKPVKKHTRMENDSVRVLFQSSIPGTPGEIVFVSQADWQAHSNRTFEAGKSRAQLRDATKK
jgi:hypothetical protein